MYKITAGNSNTDLGIVGSSKTVLGAKRIGRNAVRIMLPDGYGQYRVIDAEGAQVLREERSLRTDRAWAQK